MKVIRISNFDYEDWRGNQWIVAQRLSKEQASTVADALNSLEHADSDDFYKEVDNDYVLPEDWEP